MEAAIVQLDFNVQYGEAGNGPFRIMLLKPFSIAGKNSFGTLPPTTEDEIQSRSRARRA